MPMVLQASAILQYAVYSLILTLISKPSPRKLLAMKKIILNISVLGMLAISLTGCEKYLDINQDPNRPTAPPINGLLAATTQQTALNFQRTGNTSSYYTQYLASPNASSPTDVYDRIDLSGSWQSLYDNLADVYDLEKMAVEQRSSEHLGVAKILRAINMSMVIAMFGDVPYEEAFAGVIYTPAYNTEEEIHGICITLLDEGIAELRKTTSSIRLGTTQDFIHGGNRTAWIRTAFAIKARLLNRLSKKSSYSAVAVLSAVDSAYTSNLQDASLRTFAVRNPWAAVARNNAALVLDGWISDNLVKAMNGTRTGVFDPRLRRFTDTTRFGDFRGTPNGRGRIGTGTTRDECYLTINNYYSADNAPLFIATFEEMKMIEAEAALRANNRTRAYTAYINGITAHMTKVGVSAADRNTYLTNASIAVGETNLSLATIFREKYIVMFLHPEAWVDARRFDFNYPGFTLPVGALLTEAIRRVDWPDSERQRNAANVPGLPPLTQRLWFDRP
jgi:hypothetical protein